MIDILPEGLGIGEMKASSQWIFSHTTRFMGVVIITIHESKGFILINRGKPLKCYFKHGKRTLWGHTAYEYFRSQPFMYFELRRYNDTEMTEALNLISVEESRASDRESENGMQDIGETIQTPQEPLFPDEFSTNNEIALKLSSDITADEKSLNKTLFDEPVSDTLVAENMQGGDQSVISEPDIHFHVYSGESIMSGAGDLLLGQIINLPGVIAVSIFNRRMNILSMGDINLEYLVDVAEDLIESVKGIIPILKTGPFIQMTLQIPAGNLIIAPYWDEYLCILTSQEINLGQIRKILRDIPAGPSQQSDTD